MRTLGRRRFLHLSAGAGAALTLPMSTLPDSKDLAADPASQGGAPPRAMRTRPAPRTREPIPVVGLGTWQAFDVGASEQERAPRREVLRRLFARGGRVIDSSPMYGRAEGVVGDLLRGGAEHSRAFVATKVWTTGRAAGEAQMAESERRMGGRLDLLQIHNLVDWKTHLPTLRAWREAGRIRYLGITHYALSALEEMARIVEREEIDFVQLPYSVAVREAEARLLPACRERGAGVIVMRPFEQGELLRRLRGRPLPAWATETGAASWAQLLLQFILSHPAVTVAIPATSRPEHMDDNAGAGALPPLDEGQRRRLLRELDL
jgi:diketogulonate reductase-like aldo/keto reductase